MLKISEIFLSVQGESTQSGRVCSFVRLFGCNLRCVWCDTGYANGDAGEPSLMSVADIISAVEILYVEEDGGINTAIDNINTDNINTTADASPRLVEITGGEPLLQSETPTLCASLLSLGYEVMAETNGSQDISAFPQGVRRIVDVKCPGSSESDSFLIDNINHLVPNDELKFVLASIKDAEWAAGFCNRHDLSSRCPIIFSPAASLLPYNVLAEWIIKTRPAGVRLGLQLHKVIWGDKRGV